MFRAFTWVFVSLSGCDFGGWRLLNCWNGLSSLCRWDFTCRCGCGFYYFKFLKVCVSLFFWTIVLRDDGVIFG